MECSRYQNCVEVDMTSGRSFAIGDVHGCSKTLDNLLFNKLKITLDDDLYFVGDLIDRGQGSKEVIDRIIDLQNKGYRVNSVMGNHEYMLINSLDNTEFFQLWKKNSADTTLRSFCINNINELPQKYIDFFSSLPYYIVLNDFIIVHAGFSSTVENPFLDIDTMLWTRSEDIDLQKTGGRRVIAGHTPQPLSKIIDKLENNHIPIDGGCVYYKKFEDVGRLCCFEMNEKKLYYVINME